jgi:hypothetical protein
MELFEKDNVANSGFALPYAIMGMSGTAFKRLSFNLTLNAAASGGALLNQAWFDINSSDAVRVRIGKFKTPAHAGVLSQLGLTMFPSLPPSLVFYVNIPYDINSVNPSIATGFDAGIQVHGLLKNMIDYRVGVFNGTGSYVNEALKTLSDDMHPLPSLLYAGRIAFMPLGAMPPHQGDPDNLSSVKLLAAVSASYNVEANWESSNDLRAGCELSFLCKRLFLSAEWYMLNMDFTERQKRSVSLLFNGGYLQAGWFLNRYHQPVIRFDLFDRNGKDEKGILMFPAAGWNWYISGYNLKVQLAVQQLLKTGHKNSYAADDDDNGLSETQILLQGQFSF